MTIPGGTPEDPDGRARPPLSGPTEVDAPMLRLDHDTHRWGRAPRDRRPVRQGRLGPVPEAAVAATVALLLLPGLGQLQQQVLVRDRELFVLALVLSALVALSTAAGVHRWLGGGRRRGALVVGAVAALLAAEPWTRIAMGRTGELASLLPSRSVLEAGALATAVLAVRWSGTRRLGTAALCVALTGLATATAVQTAWPFLEAALPGPQVAAQEPVPAAPQAPAAPEPPTEPPAPASPTFGDLCHPDELETVASTPEPGGHDVATTITAVNVGSRTCRVEGWPSVQLLSEGVDLALNVHPASTQPAGDHVEPDPVELAPGEAARTQAWWPSWGAAADLDAEQELRLGVGGGVEVVLLPGLDGWDVVRSAEVWVAPWQAGDGKG